MAIQFFFICCVVLIVVASDTMFTANHTPKPSFNFCWLDDKNRFSAGDLATIKIHLSGQFNDSDIASIKHGFSPSISVNGKTGNSPYISGLALNLGVDPSTWSVSFIPISVGLFNILVTDMRFEVLDSSLHYNVQPGLMHPAVSPVSWMDYVNEFEAGTMAIVTIFPKDAFGNRLNSTMFEPNQLSFHVLATHQNGSDATILHVSPSSWGHHGIYLKFEFIVATAGDLLLHVKAKENPSFKGSSHAHINRIEYLDFRGSPLNFKVNPGMLEISKCTAEWNFGANMLQLHSRTEIYIYQLDQFNNLVPDSYPFDADVVEKNTRLSIPVANLRLNHVSSEVGLITFDANEPGDFFLMIYDAHHYRTIANVPLGFTVFNGYCDESTSIINGSGLNNSFAGEEAIFHVHIRDKYQISSPIELGILEAQIMLENSSYRATPRIHPIETITGSKEPWVGIDSLSHENAAASVTSFSHNNASAGTSKVNFFDRYDVLYTPEKAGVYDIYVLCGNVILNGGKPIKKEVKAGQVNISLSFVRYLPKVKNNVQNDIIVSLMDSYGNPVVSQQSKLKLEIVSTNDNGFLITWPFVDNRDGNYTGNYLVKDIGNYEICALFDGDHLLPCPIEIDVHSGPYFPMANNDWVSVLEDESVAIDVLGNDYFGVDAAATITEFSYPRHGSLLYNGKTFRYTPVKEFFGNDYFTYTLSDAKGCLASALVNISIHSIPPHFVSIPCYMQATEDVPSPKFGGFHGLKVTHPDLRENITVSLRAKSGTVSLSPMLVQFWQPFWNGLSVSGWDEEGRGLSLIGNVEVINTALQSIQYQGIENFYGEDTIHCLVSNGDGENDVNVNVSVEPVNDPPFIHVPEFIILRKTEGNVDSYLLYHSKSEFFIGDPDLSNFPGDKSEFVVMLSIEVDSGTLEATLPVEVVNTTEQKSVGSSHHHNRHQWQPFLTYVSMEKQVSVKIKGLRFQGTIDECNSIIQQLKYQRGDDDEEGAVLTISVNDLGNYGCYQADCAENMTRPLSVEASVNLIYRKPIGSVAAHALAAAVIFEFLMVLCLGVLLMSFTCKCIVSLMYDGKRRTTTTTLNDVTGADLYPEPNEVTTSSAGCFRAPFLFGTNKPFNSNRQPQIQPPNSGAASCPECSPSSPPTCVSLEPPAIRFGSFSIEESKLND